MGQTTQLAAIETAEILAEELALLHWQVDYAVDARYPGNNASKRQAVAALRWEGRTRDTCREHLGIHPPRRRKSP